MHLHSMIVHAVIAMAPLAAAAMILEARSVSVAGIGPPVWALLFRGSLAVILVLGLPAITTGISERNHIYVNWPPSHRIKLVLSVVLVILAASELAAVLGTRGPPRLGSVLAAAVIGGNCALVAGLSALGLRITLGRQSLARTSYKADMDFDPPVDILDCVAESADDPPKIIDVRGEV